MDDIAFVAADAVVRPTTADLEPISPSLRRLEQIGGPSFWKQLEIHEELAVGAAVVTGAGGLSADFVIHAIIRSAAEAVSAAGVRRALTSVLHRASAWQLSCIAIPPLGVGPGSLSVEQAAQAMLESLHENMRRSPYPSEVQIIVENEEERSVFDSYL